jgi:hypothetical protein
MTWRDSSEEESAPRISVTRLSEEPPRGRARARLVDQLIGIVNAVLDKVAGRPSGPVQGALRAVAKDGTKVISEAAAGRLEAMSLEGDHKLAEITEKYASARLHNAQASQIEQQMAFERLERSIALLKAAGVKFEVGARADGTPVLIVGGQRLAESLEAETHDTEVRSIPSGE